VASQSGVGFRRTLCVRGADGAGFFLGTPTSPPKPVLYSISTTDAGKGAADDEFVLSADEKTQIPIRTRCHPILPPGPGRSIRVEHEYRRHGVCAYIAAWDVHRARLFGDVVNKISIRAFDTLVARVLSQEPYRSARRVFWIVDGGTIHRGPRAVNRLQSRHDNLKLVHLPKHASWLNQIEIYCLLAVLSG